jgi:hypothetical protein
LHRAKPAAVGLVGLAAPAASASPAPRGHPTYLALGDSVPFGYRANLPPIFYNFPQLFVGYPEIVGPTFRLRTLNAACPGETTSFLTGAGSNGCEDSVTGTTGYRDLFPLHVRYSGTQLQYALDTLHRNSDVRLVSLMLGANDGFICQKTTSDQCATELPGVLNTIGTSLAAILAQLRSAYSGRIVVVTYYALDYSDGTGVAVTQLLNGAIMAAAASVPGVVVADGFGAFQQRAIAAGGSSIAAPVARLLSRGRATPAALMR